MEFVSGLCRVRLRSGRGIEEVLAAVEKVKGKPRAEWLDRHGNEGKWLVLKLAREQTGLTLAELGEVIGGKAYAAISVGLKRFEQRVSEKRRLKQLLQRGREMLKIET